MHVKHHVDLPGGLSVELLSSALELAKKSATDTAALLRDSYLLWLTSSERGGKHSKDVKLTADIRAHEYIVSSLGSHSEWPILSEEGDLPKWLPSEPFWLVDPLDGTANYKRKQPAAVSIALMCGEIFVLGVVVSIWSGSCYAGSLISPATKNGQNIQVSQLVNPDAACILTGPGDYNKQVALWSSYVAQYQMLRMLGTAALSCVWIAEGRADIYMEAKRQLWDVAAGVAIVSAAGGVVHCHKLSPWVVDVSLAAHQDLIT